MNDSSNARRSPGLLRDVKTAPPATLSEIWSRPLPFLDGDPLTRFLCRSVSSLSLRFIVDIEGLDVVQPSRDPFVLALNHSQRMEAVLVPTRLIHERRGRLLHFVADWQYLLVPFVAMLYRRSRVVVSKTKSARPKLFNALRPLVCPSESVFRQAKQRIAAGGSVGIFPEGRMNRDPHRLLPGHLGAARLAMATGAPIVPGGISFPMHDPAQPIRDSSRMRIRLGEPLEPPRAATRGAARAFHHAIMSEISALSGKRLSEQGLITSEPNHGQPGGETLAE